MSRAHIDSRLGLKGISSSADKDTVFLAHYDISLNDISGLKSFGDHVDDYTILNYTMSNIKTNSVGTFVIDKGMTGKHAKVEGTTLAYGRNGKSMKFNGTSNYIESYPIIITENFSVSFWIYFETGETSANSWILSNRQTADDGISIFLMNNSSLYFDFGGAANRWDTGYVPPRNQWVHITLIRNPYTRVLYVDGIETAAIGSSGNLALANTNRPLKIGTDNQTFFFKGSIDTLHIWNKELAEEDIMQIYNEPIYTLYPTSGKYGGAVAVQDSTINLIDTSSTEALGSVIKTGGWVDFNSTGEYIYDYTPLGYLKVAHNTAWVDINKDPVYDGGGSIFGSIGNEKITVTPNTTYTISFHLKVKERDYFNNNFLYLQEFNASLVQLSEIGIANKNNRIYLNDKWYKIFATFTTSPTTTSIQIQHYQYDTLGNEFWFFGTQLEQKHFATSFTEGSREKGKVIYPVMITGDFTLSFWTRFDCKWYTLQTGYNKPLIELYNSISGGKITWIDNASALNTDSSFFDLEPNTYWDNITHHWNTTFNYQTNRWYYVVLVKQGNILRQIIYDYSDDTKTIDKTFTYSDSDKFTTSTFDQLILYGDWSTFIDEIRVDNRAIDEEEILTWYLSDVPFFPRGAERSVY